MPPLLPPSSELSVCPELSACPEMTTEVIPLSTTLPVLGVIMWCVWATHTIPELSTCLDFSPTFPLLPPPVIPALAPPLLSPGSPLAHPQPTICGVGSPWVCQSPSASWLEDPVSLLPASEFLAPSLPFDPVAPPRLLAPSSPLRPVSPPAPPGSLIPPAPPWSVVDHLPPLDSTPPATPHHSAHPSSSHHPSVRLLLPSRSTLVLCCSTSTTAFWIPASALALWILGITLVCQLTVSVLGSTTTCSAAVGQSPGVSTVGRHHVCGLDPTKLFLLPHIFSLTPPYVGSTLDLGCCPPPGCPSSARKSTILVCLPFCQPFAVPSPSLLHSLCPPLSRPLLLLRREVAPSRRGVNCQTYGHVLLCLHSPGV
ncbi:IgA FC receptor [Labeo rohita]|uniref:IgA FC receptor n=1 Tax=Labeo rohita TaxID=84645 RepID=A0ABQ8MYR5_LABRO|nr:IgA FC receptor [Labeo rohita]